MFQSKGQCVRERERERERKRERGKWRVTVIGELEKRKSTKEMQGRDGKQHRNPRSLLNHYHSAVSGSPV